MADGPTLSFLGGAGTVTGSKFLIAAGDTRVLLDCGLFQGLRELRHRNWAAPTFAPDRLAGVVLSHAHVDHSGWLPVLVRRGFRGAVHCTAATADLLQILLLDAAKLQEEEAAAANRYRYGRHDPALPLYTAADAEAALRLLVTHPYGEPFPVADGVAATFHRAGHILGSATVELAVGRERLLFTGDLGRAGRPILRDPDPAVAADTVLVESTYGDRLHARDGAAQVARVVREAVARGGPLLMPAFAVGRTQELLWTLRELEDQGTIPSLPVFVDSPMAIDVTEIYCRHPEDHDLEMTVLADAKRCPLCSRGQQLVRTGAESKALNRRDGPMIVIAGSGMATGGRILHHLKLRLPDPRTTVLLPGFQAIDTRGRKLQEGARTLEIHGRTVPVRATVETLDGLSAHADRDEILDWLGGMPRAPRRVWVVHGEPPAAAGLAQAIEARFGWPVAVAPDGATVSLGS
ncbi:MAG TPA: MBL fold metallo-hydrolase [Candidatus Binatia bacterium]|nr:MBL fold metallo-hydrolase [Candidatus Binatia bacterium]